MIDVSISTAESGAKKVRLGKQGENGVRKIIFDLQSMVNRYGDGLATLVFQRNGDTAPYVVTVTREENSLVWIVSSTDTAKAGPGRAEIRWFVDGALAKTVIFATETIASIVEDTEMPDVMQTWYDQMVDYVDAQPQIVIGEVQRMIDGKADAAAVDNVYAKKTDIPTKISKLTNDAGFISEIPEEYVTDTELEDVRTSLSAMIGSPLVAASAAEMTDTDRVYVYTGAETGYENGDWYYYDSGISQWRSGGVYNSTAVTTDKTLSVENSAADAKATGDAITSLNEDITNLETNKQDVLTFDSAPTAESTNPVTSAGIKMALDSVDAEIGELKENLSESVSDLKSALNDTGSALTEVRNDVYPKIGGMKRFDECRFNINNQYPNRYTTKYIISIPANKKVTLRVVADAAIVPSFLLYANDGTSDHNLGSKSPNTDIIINESYAISFISIYYGTKVTTSIQYLFYEEETRTLATKTELQQDKEELQQTIGNFKIVDGSTLDWDEDTYINASTGAAVANSSWYSTPFISVLPETNITIALSNSSTVVGVAWYDENKKYIDGEPLVYNHSYVGEFDVKSPKAAKYMRYSTSSLTWSTSFSLLKDSVLDLTYNVYNAIETQEESTSSVYWEYAMDKILCIGDSLTSGAYYDGSAFNGASIAQNYPYFIGRILNTEATNAGVSGISVKGWLDDESDKYTYTNYNTIIIWLGSNYGLLKTLPENPTEGQTKAYQNYVAYRQLLTKIQTANPNALIVMCKIYFTNYWVDISNAALEDIATEFNLPLVDLSDLNTENYPEYRYSEVNWYHLIKCGNIVVASRIIESMRNWFAESPKRCEFGLSARVN